MELQILSVNVGQPRIIGTRAGQPLISAIGKSPIAASSVHVYLLGLAGDAQANPRVHGGVDKAIYAYPADHWGWWKSEHDIVSSPASFGENLTLEGADETQIHIGDRFAWGEIELEVSQPRSPCNKLEVYSGRPGIGSIMTISGRCGWYFRVMTEGDVAVTGARLRRTMSGEGPSVRDAFHAAFSKKLDPQIKRRFADTHALSAAWREKLV